MPGPIEVVAPTIVRFSMQGTVTGGQKWANVVDVSLDEFGESRADGVNTMVPLVVQHFQDRIVGIVCASVQFTGAAWLDLDSLDGTRGFQPPIAAHPTVGGNASSALPPNNTYLCLKTCVHNRRQRTGRMFVPGVPESMVDDAGTISGSHQSGLSTAFEGFRTDVVGISDVAGLETVAWRVVHILTYSGEAEPGWPNGRPTSWNSTDVTHAACASKIGVQRRRLK